MNNHNGPLSPVSVAGSEWSGVTHYQSQDRSYSSTLVSNNFSRSNLPTPPVSGSSHNLNGNLANGMNGRPNDYRSNPSPPSSVARSSNGTTMSLEGQRRKQSMMEDNLAQHYIELKGFLATTLRDEKTNGKPNRARDKLLRLSPVQFQELSTDVYDELLRRKVQDRLPPSEREKRPAFLLPKENFHPKRNQARQKLSTLPIARFTALATDVFFELERRFPRFAAGDINRRDSPANSMRGPPSRTQTPNGYRPDIRDSQGSRQSSRRPGASRQGSLGGQVLAGLGIPGMGSQDDYSRPAPKTSQSNTIVPNKSYLVEDDDDQEYTDDVYGMNKRDTQMTTRSASSIDRDKKMIADYQLQLNELQGKVGDLESQVRAKDTTISSLESGRREFEEAGNEWSQLQRDLENKLEEALKLNDNLHSEIEKVKSQHSDRERSLRAELEQTAKQGNGNNEWKRRYEDVRQENEDLQRELQDQQKVTNEVRQEAFAFLNEMKALSDRSGQSWEREEKLVQQVHRLEEEVSEWKSRYARTKTQLRTLRTTSMGMAIHPPNAGQYAKDGSLTREDGLVKDVHVTKFQISIDEVLRTARTSEPQAVIDSMKSVVAAVRNICQDITDSVSSDDELQQQRAKLRSNVSGTANNFITASKNYAQSNGVSPISLLDAAASHLAAAVVELVRTVKVRPTPAGELGDDDDAHLVNGSAQHQNHNAFNRRSSITESIYSSRTSGLPTSPPPLNRIPPRSQPTENHFTRDNPSRNGGAIPAKASEALARPAYGMPARDAEVDDLKLFLEDQTESLVHTIQSLVSSIRTIDNPDIVEAKIASIATIITAVVKETQRVIDTSQNPLLAEAGPVVRNLANCKAKLLAAEDDGKETQNHAEWKEHINVLPPIAFEIARETKELVGRVERVGERRDSADDFRL